MANDERDAQLDGHKLSNLLQSFTSSGDRKVVCDGAWELLRTRTPSGSEGRS